jgi:hypothetical protein
LAPGLIEGERPMTQPRVGMIVRTIVAGELFRIDTVMKNGRLWLSNSFDSKLADADEVELASEEHPADESPKAAEIPNPTSWLANYRWN